MIHKNIKFQSTDEDPHYEALKLKLGSLRGMLSMDIENDSGHVSVEYDDEYITENQLNRCLEDIGYYPMNMVKH